MDFFTAKDMNDDSMEYGSCVWDSELNFPVNKTIGAVKGLLITVSELPSKITLTTLIMLLSYIFTYTLLQLSYITYCD